MVIWRIYLQRQVIFVNICLIGKESGRLYNNGDLEKTLMLHRFNDPWDKVPLACIDTECTGKQPGIDKTVSFGIARFENGVFVNGIERLVNPGVPIPAEATAIHGITDDMVRDAPSLHEAFFTSEVQEMLEGAQPCAFNCSFDRNFVPPFGKDWSWPWLDCLMMVRYVDRYVSGSGRHKLSVTCARHGIVLENAHSALADAKACGELLYKIGKKTFPKDYPLGRAIDWCKRTEQIEWLRYNLWRSRLPEIKDETT